MAPLPGALLAESDLIVTETYNYGGRGGRVSERTTVLSSFGARVFRQSFTWDALGNLQGSTYPTYLHAPCNSQAHISRTNSSSQVT